MVRKGSGATTVLRAHGVLSGILADAVKVQTTGGQHPASGVENLPRKTGERRVYLSADDVYRRPTNAASTAPSSWCWPTPASAGVKW
jgi:hypothetical protein